MNSFFQAGETVVVDESVDGKEFKGKITGLSREGFFVVEDDNGGKFYVTAREISKE